MDGNTFTYDSENHMTSMTAGPTFITMKYDAFGNRVLKTVTNTVAHTSVTTQYLVEDDVNPTGYPQVVEELTGPIGLGAVTRTYTYGLQRISENLSPAVTGNGTWTPSFYGYDGFGTVRQLTSVAGAVTDTYEYDAFGNFFTKSGTTPNNYLYRGEQYDSDLGLYYLRARYYNTMTGRFVSMDPENGIVTDPKTLHKYLYTSSDPVNRIDPSGRSDLLEGTMIFALETVKAAPLLIPIAKYVNCVLHTAAVTLDLAIPPDGYHLEYLMPNLKDCTAKARYCKDGDSDCDDFTGTHGPWHYGNWCGAGGAGTPIDSTDAACMRHDKCYDSIGFAADQYTSGNLSPSQMQAAAACNQQLCNAVKNANSNSSTPPGQRIAGIQILGFFTYFGPAGGRCR